MKIKLKIEKEYDVKYLQAKVGARYWEDAVVNGVEDVDGDLIPFHHGDYWCPLIELETGKVHDWPIGTVADIHYKSCDNNYFALLDKNMNVIKELVGSSVINMMCPLKAGHGDYVIMGIDSDGIIRGFKADLSDFED